jgi:acetyl esterase/lipase
MAQHAGRRRRHGGVRGLSAGAAAPFPDAVEVGYEALESLYKQRTKLAGKARRVYLAGEEAGGNLAAASP